MTIISPTTDLADDADALPTSDVMGTPERATAAMSAMGRAGPGGQQATNPIAKTTTAMDGKPKNLVDSGIDLKTPLTQAEAAEQIEKLITALMGKREGLWLKTYPDSLYSEDESNTTKQLLILKLFAISDPQSFTPESRQLLARFNLENPQPTIQAIKQQPALANALNQSLEKLTPITPTVSALRSAETDKVSTFSGRVITRHQLREILHNKSVRLELLAQLRRLRRPRMPLRQGPVRLRRPRRMIKPVEEALTPKIVELTPPLDLTRLEVNRAANDHNAKTEAAAPRQPRTLPRRVSDWVRNTRAKIAAR